MKHTFISVLATVWLCLCTLSSSAQTKRYVKPVASGSGNGSSWTNASADLQLMIDNAAPGDSVFVAAGTYRPNRAANNTSIVNAANRDNAFVLRTNVKIYGGFAGTEATLAQRILNPSAPSVLNGDLGTLGNTADNTYHVVVCVEGNLFNPAVLDGFTVSAGNANGTGSLTVGTATIPRNYGGGIWITAFAPNIANCRFLQNIAADRGGAIYTISAFSTITFCSFEDNNGAGYGGGIFHDGGFHSIISCSFIANRSASGAALYNFNGTQTTVTDCGFLNHVNVNLGGAVYNNLSEAFFTRCTFTGNTATTWGGAMFNNGSSPQLISCTFTGNLAIQNGGAVYNYLNSDPLIYYTTFTNNIATNGGGAMFNEADAGPSINFSSFIGNSAAFGGGLWNNGVPVLTGCQFRGNWANSYGGAVYNMTTSPRFDNCLFTGNVTINPGGGGAGMFNNTSSPTVINCTFSGNRDTDNGNIGGGMHNLNNSAPIIRNSIFWGNSSDITISNSPAPTANNNIIQSGAFGGSTGNPFFTNAPSYTTAAFTGGDYTLTDCSAAVNAGNNLYSTQTEDLAGNVRIYAGVVDLGAYEYFGGFTVTGNIIYVDANVAGGTGKGDSWANAMPHLSDALRFAKENESFWSAAGPLKILVAKGTYKPKYQPHIYCGVDPNGRANTFLMVKHVQLYGGFDPANGIDDLSDARIFGATGTILNGDVGVVDNISDNVHHVVLSVGDVGTALLDGFTLTKGNANSTGLMTVNGQTLEIISGGGMFIYLSSPQIFNCSFIGNEIFTHDNRPSHGAGLGIEKNSNPVITNCRFYQNTASGYGDGGGIGTYDNSAPVITNCAFNKNITGANGCGAAISLRTGSATIKGCVMYGNLAGGAGGGLFMDGNPQVSLLSCTFNDNHAPANHGGGIYGFQTVVPGTMLNNIIYGNPGGNIISSTNFPVTPPSTNMTYDPLFIYTIAGTGVGPDGLLGTADDWLRLQQASPAINMGSDTTGLNLPATDIIGSVRVQESRIDLGAYESPYINCSTFNTRIYVDSSVTLSGDGSTWATAFKSLSEALATTGKCTNIDSILVAIGTYYPDSIAGNGSTNRDKAFVLAPNVKIYGGFPTGGGTLAQRVLPSATTPGNTILSGDIDKNDVISNGITTTFNGSNALHVVIAAGNIGTAELNGFTVTGGNADIEDITITINGQSVKRSYGGGLYNMASSPVIKNCSFAGNNCLAAGSGIYNQSSSPAISDCFFRKNSTNLGWGSGMANYAGSNGAILRCRFEENSGSQAAGMVNYNSSPTITDCIFSGNTVQEFAGAMLNLENSSPAIRNCLFTGNRCTLSLASGGAILNSDNSSPLIFNCTFAGNYVPDPTLGGAIWNESNSVPVIRNTIIYGNSSGIRKEASTPVANVSFSIVQGGHTGAADTDPLFINSPAAATAPFTGGDYRLLNVSSFAVNSGTPGIAGLNLPATDIAGLPRVQGGRIDMGAHESPYFICNTVLYVDSSKAISGNGVSWATAFKTLEEAFVLSKQCGTTDSILVAKGTYYPDSIPGTLLSGVNDKDRTFRLLRNVKLIGGYPTGGGSFAQRVLPSATSPGNTILSGDLDKNDVISNGITTTFNGNNAYHVIISVNNAGTAVFDGFTVTGGYAQDNQGGGLFIDGTLIVREQGGGMYNYSSSPVIRNCSFSGNYTHHGKGGGLTNEASSPAISDCFFMKNRSEQGMGIGMGNLTGSNGAILRCRFEGNESYWGWGSGMANLSGSPTITDCIFSGNIFGGYGGGIYNYGTSPVIINCLFTGNRGSTSFGSLGGAIGNNFSSPVIINCTFAGNYVLDPAYGGAIWNEEYSVPVIRNSIIYGNSSGIVTDNQSPAGPAIVSNSIVQGGYPGAIDADPQFFNSPAPATAPFTGGDYRLQNCSPAINAGNNAAVPGAVLTDVATQPRIQLGTVDMGAYESIANETTAGLAVNDTVITKLQSSNSATLYITHCNTLVAKVTGDGTPASISGNTVAKLWIEDVQPAGFVKRHVEIMPQTGTPATATAGITLYFTQAEFNDFNAVNLVKLPQDPADAAGKANLMIEKRSGVSNDNTGLPPSYTGAIVTINPDDANITWNAAAARWEVSFSVTGFSGFFVKTQMGTLPLRLVSFTAKENNCTSILEWITAEEDNVSHFEIEQSVNGSSYTLVKTIPARNTDIQNTYTVAVPVADNNVHYRLKMVDNDGKIKYSPVVAVTADCSSKIVLYPNPAKDRLYMKNATPGSNYFLYDNMGRLTYSGNITNSIQEIRIAGLAAGMYHISVVNVNGSRAEMQFIKE